MSNVRRGRCPECGDSFDPPVSQCPSCAEGLMFPEPPMTNDEWVEEQCDRIAGFVINNQQAADVHSMTRAALREAFERGKAEQDKAVAAERRTLQNIAVNADDRAQAAEAKLAENRDFIEALHRAGKMVASEVDWFKAAFARLANPDEALGRVLVPDYWAYVESEQKRRFKAAGERIAATLADGKENNDG